MSTPSMTSAIKRLVETALQEVRIGVPARVESYDAATNSCSVKPLIMENYYDEENNLVGESLPVIGDVPVLFPGVGAFSLTFPLSIGDTVWLMFSTSSLEAWLTYGGEVDPKREQKFSLSDAVAYPGVRPFYAPTTHVHSTAMVLAAPDLRLGD